MKVSKSAIIHEVSKELDIDVALVREVLDAVIVEVVDNLCEKRSVVLQNFGTFTPFDFPNNLHFGDAKSFLKIAFRPSKNFRRILPKGE